MLQTQNQTYPSLLRRFACIIYDLLLLIAICIAYGLAYLAVSKLILQVTEDRAEGILFQLGWLSTIITFYCYFWMHGGQTTGMRAWRIQIINSENKPLNILQCVLRTLLAPIGWLFCFSLFFDKHQQCLHDKWTNTRLILLKKDT